MRSGIRFDYLINDKDETFFRELVKYHVSGQLKVAPEHISDGVLRMMGKPQNSVYRRFVKRYKELNEEMHLNQYLVPYLMSSHPGSTLQDAVKLAEYLRDLGYMPEQVQDFYPTPSTISTCMYYTGARSAHNEACIRRARPARKSDAARSSSTVTRKITTSSRKRSSKRIAATSLAQAKLPLAPPPR